MQRALGGVGNGDQGAPLRALGGLLLGVAILVILIRRTLTIDPWGDFVIFIVLLVPTVILYGAGYRGARARDGQPTVWQIVFTVFGTLLLVFTLFAFLNWVGGDADSNLNTAWIFAVVAIAAFAAALAAGVRFGCLLGALALLVVWFALWDELLDGGIAAHVTTTRWLLLIVAALLGALAAILASRQRPEGGSSDVLAVAGAAAVGAGAVSLGALNSTPVETIAGIAEPTSAIGSSTFWELEMLVVSLALVVYGSTASTRGPAYVGALGLVAFIPIVGVDAGHVNLDGSLWGWPVVLLVVALGLLAAGAIASNRRAGE